MTIELDTHIGVDEFNAHWARKWIKKVTASKMHEAYSFMQETVITYVREACLKGSYTTDLPGIDHAVALHVLQLLQRKGFAVVKNARESTDDLTVLTVSWFTREMDDTE